MSKIVDNDTYNKALSNFDNQKIMLAVTHKFKNCLNEDELISCRLNGLWQALRTWNPEYKTNKFTSFLYQKVYWECIRELRSKPKTKTLPIVDRSVLPKLSMFEIIEELSEELQDILYKRYIEGRTLREISEHYGCCHETIRRKIKKAIKSLKFSKNGV